MLNKRKPSSLIRFWFAGISLLGLLCASAAHAEKLAVAQEEIYTNSPAYLQLKDFMRATLAKAGLEAEYVALPLTRANVMNVSGEVDAQLIRAPSVLKDFPQLRGTSFPIFFTNVRFIYLKNNKSFDENSLQKYNGVGPLNNAGLTEAIKDQQLKLVEVRNLSQAVGMLRSQRVDYILLPEEILKGLYEKFPGLEAEAKLSKRIFLRYPLHFIVNEKKAYLLPKIEKAFREEVKKSLEHYPLIKESLNTTP